MLMLYKHTPTGSVDFASVNVRWARLCAFDFVMVVVVFIVVIVGRRRLIIVHVCMGRIFVNEIQPFVAFSYSLETAIIEPADKLRIYFECFYFCAFVWSFFFHFLCIFQFALSTMVDSTDID